MKKFEVHDFSAEELDKMSIEELELHSQAINEVRLAIKAEAQQVAEVINRKSQDEEILTQHKFRDLPEEKRKAVLQILKGDNIKKEESVRKGGE